MTTNIVPSNFVRFDADGLELVVDTSTGKAYASISATARMLETARSTVQSAILTCRDFSTKSAEIPTNKGLQAAELLPAFAVFKLAQKYHPRLADAMGEAGANLYLLKLAGYEPKIVESPQIPQTYAAALLEAGRLAMELEAASAKIEADRPLVEYAESVQCSDDTIEFNEFAKMMGTGRTRLFRAMRDAGVIMQGSTLPYQKFCDAGYFEVSQEITSTGRLVPFALVTGKGQIWLKQRLSKQSNCNLIEAI
jgi:phage antirepressor YoqD-like protein